MKSKCKTIVAALILTLIAGPVHSWMCGIAEQGFLVPEEVLLPANAQGLLWWGVLSECDAHGKFSRTLTLEDLASAFDAKILRNGQYVSTEFDLEMLNYEEPGYPHYYLHSEIALVHVKPREMKPGDELLLTYDATLRKSCPYTVNEPLKQEIRVTVSRRNIFLSETVELHVGELRQVKRDLIDYGVGTEKKMLSAVPVEAFSVDIERWRDVLHFSTYVDGKLWRPQPDACRETAPGESWVGKGKELIYVNCAREKASAEEEDAPEDGVIPAELRSGVHEVRMSVTLPGTANEATSSTASFEISCEEPHAPKQAPDNGIQHD